jgi:hypothetical protein
MKTICKSLIILTIIGSLFIACGKDKEKLEEIYDEPGYAIGEVTASLSSTLTFSITYYYSYTLNGIDYEGEKSDFQLGDGSDRVGYKYLVVYKLSDPSVSDLNFNYLIKSEEDFQDLLVQFESDPPTP